MNPLSYGGTPLNPFVFVSPINEWISNQQKKFFIILQVIENGKIERSKTLLCFAVTKKQIGSLMHIKSAPTQCR